MSASATSDHDQRLKVLLKEFFEQFFLCFFPAWAARFDFGDVTWLDKEVFLAPPQGEKRQLDLVTRLRIRSGSPPPQPRLTELLALVHIEVESRESVQPLRPRMFAYYVQLRRDSQCCRSVYSSASGSTGSAGMPMRSSSGSIACSASITLMSACRDWMLSPL
jgi:hypothetical protein